MKNIILIIVFFLFISCQGLKDAGKVLRNEKIKNTDEFLVEKRNPLVLPPNFEEIPVPGSVSKSKKNEDDKIKQIFKTPNSENITKSESSTIEESILNRIRK